jgi:hypothetical protein
MEGQSGRILQYHVQFWFAPEQSYRKYHLVPFGEYIPLKAVFGWIIHILQIPLSDFSRGSLDQKPMYLAGQRIAINICYEDVFGEEIIKQLPDATLLVNVSNDAWFGRSIGPQQHLQISQMRALETGRYMLRATNTGVTAIIDERGQVLQSIEIFTTAALHSMVQGFTGTTPYVRGGNYPVLLFAGLLCIIALALLRAKSKGPQKTVNSHLFVFISTGFNRRMAITQPTTQSFQDIIFTLQRFWAKQGCAIFKLMTWKSAQGPVTATFCVPSAPSLESCLCTTLFVPRRALWR